MHYLPFKQSLTNHISPKTKKYFTLTNAHTQNFSALAQGSPPLSAIGQYMWRHRMLVQSRIGCNISLQTNLIFLRKRANPCNLQGIGCIKNLLYAHDTYYVQKIAIYCKRTRVPLWFLHSTKYGHDKRRKICVDFMFIRRCVNGFLVLHISSRYTTKFQIVPHWNSHRSRYITCSCHLNLLHTLSDLT